MLRGYSLPNAQLPSYVTPMSTTGDVISHNFQGQAALEPFSATFIFTKSAEVAKVLSYWLNSILSEYIFWSLSYFPISGLALLISTDTNFTYQ